MTTTLVVLAHPNPGSFNGAWADATVQAARAQGDVVLKSDLCAMNFDPVEGAHHYRDQTGGEGCFDPLKAQEQAATAGQIPVDVQAEVDKLTQADRVVFHFPLWWFAPPAVLKGWFDRVFVHGALHSVDQRFDSGRFKGKSAVFCVTAGASHTESAPGGKEGDIAMLLWPTAYTLRYLGFDVLTPLIAHDVHRYHQGAQKSQLEHALRSLLDAQTDLMRGFDTHPRLQFNADADFDAAGTLRPDRPSHSHFIRHEV